jgi:DNA repair protein REV1
MHKTAHITKQLRPKMKTQMKASAISSLPLYGAWNKAQQQNDDEEDSFDIVDLSRSKDDDDGKIGVYYIRDLRDLGIDPSFLRDLPEEMQKEVVDAEIARKKQRQLLHRPADTSRARQQARVRGVQARDSISPTRSSRAGSVPPIVPRAAGPTITITRPLKPKLYNATTLPEVCEIVTKWIESRKGSGPAIKDANKVKAYLVKCLTPESGLAGVETAIEVLKFMRVTIDSKWEQGACEDDIAATEWWETWNRFRSEVDLLHRQRFGVGVRI